ncbi:MAG: TM2 domain-containing protein [Flavobacterium sp.]|jgi:TM2 domain-containing membrane protein YozV|uniref:TM2 domain-containing protein n=1 Tax=Flavobacterium sp. TaxID=239 RepID=UPI002978A1BE|nr:TM2 domain-containing protein [Flavobacterium sp.]TAF09067.1 MAG: TM2 domain-containing protein [Flavobacteriia bacterium]WRH74111.1 MAG: TM2 domain-containing protein [Flavobacterium sp.]
MKIKLFLSALMLTFGALTISYASFPVEKTTTNNVTVVENQEDELSSPATADSGKSQVTALILVALIGGLGIHRFYLGYTWQGIVQLLTLGGCGIWALIDLIRIITGDLQPKNGSYSKTL